MIRLQIKHFSGSRFALMELKIVFYYLLLNFSFERNENTQIPLKFKKDPTMNTENGVHLELRPRKNRKIKQYFELQVVAKNH